MTDSFSLFDMLLLAIAVYVLYAGIVGKGRLFSLENIKEGMEKEYISMSRKFYILLGVFMLINSGASLLRGVFYQQVVTAATDTTAASATWEAKVELGKFAFMTPQVFTIISYVALGITLALIILLAVLMRKFMDKDAARKRAEASGAAPRPNPNALPRSAFEFDDEDKGEGQSK
ncbi:hypothetical protein SDC9_67932 [bioreactor metagenome]|jgi:hypothetical protein|uniref:Uncharacterized protein n=1 Tax=bioreactor metagenome TaxID=1076179 RepID=A0A644Y0C3_9ZZZZ